jgi:hypothetical protein
MFLRKKAWSPHKPGEYDRRPRPLPGSVVSGAGAGREASMDRVNVDIKAVCRDPAAARAVLGALGAERRAAGSQADTYFRVARRRLELREGTPRTA